MSGLLSPLAGVYTYSLQPIAPFTWFGWGISTLDVVATVRLCIVLRQLRESMLKDHVSTKGKSNVEQTSFVRSAVTTLLVVYGGEAVAGMCLLYPASLDTKEFVIG